MTLRKADWRAIAAGSAAAVLTLLLALAGCLSPNTPTATPPTAPSPTPTSSPFSAEVNIYLMLVAPVTSDTAILYARDQPIGVLEDLVAELKLIVPPSEMVEAHQLLQEGYELLVEGGTLLQSQPDPALRSEAIFIQDWGVRQLWEYRRAVAKLKAQAEATAP